MSEQINEIRDVLDSMAQQCHFEMCDYKDINFFKILGIQKNEVLICRLLVFLLTPDNVYGAGVGPLRQFLTRISKNGCNYSDEELRTASVIPEEHIKEDRRVDIAIYIGGDVYPIEVKIDAEDQKAQLFDYYWYYKENSKCRIDAIYYLTLNGREPSHDSVSPKNENDRRILPQYAVHCLSFKKHIVSWLDQILPTNLNYSFVLDQFKEVVKIMCAQYINKENLNAALDLNNGFKSDSRMELLLNIMSMDQNELWKDIRDKYLRNCLKFDSKYELSTDDLSVNNSLYSIKNKQTGQFIAWICVDTNLYIVSKSKPKEWKEADGYFWHHISPVVAEKCPVAAEKFPLKKANPNISDSDCIPLDDLLAQIEACQ